MHYKIPEKKPETELLDTIVAPADIRLLSTAQLQQLADELRLYLLYSVGQSGGHFGAGLGVVELTIALHYMYRTPDDHVIWDVGHQSYPHKILTGRKEQLARIRQKDGPAPFPSRNESAYDFFGVGHSSTSISAALGSAISARLAGINRRVVAVIGDGALTAGMAFEALNHAGSEQPNMLIVLNDNNMSISHNVGAMSNSFARFFAGHFYNTARSVIKQTLKPMPHISRLVKQIETQGKSVIVPPSMLFEAINCSYHGPIDGHDIPLLIDSLRNIRDVSGVHLLHVRTVKGKGFSRAENDPVGYHALAKVQPLVTPTPKKRTCSNVFGTWICDMAKQDDALVAITPAMKEGSDLIRFSEDYADRYFDVGIAEQHALTFAAGLACSGHKPVVAIYSTFLQRAYDQLIHDICLQNCDVTFAVDRAGLVGEDGPTHHGVFDYSFCRCLPNVVVMAPSHEAELRLMLSSAYAYQGPAFVRYPRGNLSDKNEGTAMDTVELGKAEIVQETSSRELVILAFGSMVATLLPIARECNYTLINMRFIKPLDEALLKKVTREYRHIVSVEENVVAGGAGSAINEWMQKQGVTKQLHIIGIPDIFIEHGSRQSQLEQAGISKEQLQNRLQTIVSTK